MFNPRFRSTLGKALIFCLCAVFTFSPVTTVFAQHTLKSAAIPTGKSAPALAPTAKMSARTAQQTADSSQAVTGSPWTGDVGSQETTAQIMAREAAMGRQSKPPEFA